MDTLQAIDGSRINLPSASSMDRLIACPGSYRLEQVNQSNESSKDAERGTRIHEANESGDVTELIEDEASIVERTRAIEQAHYDQWMNEFNLRPVRIVREERLFISYPMEPIASVKIDFYAEGVTAFGVIHCLVLDLKSGRKEVTEPASNWQLRTAAVALFREVDASHVRVAIVQPLAKRQPPCDYDHASLTAAYRLLVSKLAATKLEDAPLSVGDWCTYCPVRMTCPKQEEVENSLVTLKEASWDAILPEAKPELRRRAKMVKKICEDMIARIDRETDEGLIPGLVRSPGTNVRSVNKIIELYGILSKTFGEKLTHEKFNAICDVSIGKEGLEGLVREISDRDSKNKPITWDKAKEWVNDACAPVIELKPKLGSIIEAPKQLEEK